MQTLNIKKFGLAFGITCALLYIGCILLMLIAGREGTIFIFNSFFHGLNTEAIIRMDIPWWETLTGLSATFGLGWLTGASVAFFYNKSVQNV
ncbi:MAG: DUF5676 family membrane protein [Bacteroidales bacterium]|nr:DUF5676 family membrane protein [Bacteroidales bacterium]MCF6342224.1 DUF5676 family membrane protein [Bacteroidales bacterium]